MRLLLLYALFAVNPLIHASVEIVLDETVIQVDPWSAGDLSRARAADLILVTDDPIHHLDPKAIRQLRKPDGVVLIPADGGTEDGTKKDFEPIFGAIGQATGLKFDIKIGQSYGAVVEAMCNGAADGPRLNASMRMQMSSCAAFAYSSSMSK